RYLFAHYRWRGRSNPAAINQKRLAGSLPNRDSAPATDEPVLLARLHSLPFTCPSLFSISHPASRTHDPKRTGNSGDESSEFFRSASGGQRFRSRDFFSRPQNIARALVLGLASAQTERHSSRSGRQRSQRSQSIDSNFTGGTSDARFSGR